MSNFIDITGNKYNRLKVIKKHSKEKNGEWKWLCECDCGNQTVVRGRSLRNNLIYSCGCYKLEKKTKHGQYGTRLYSIWQSMKHRCYDKKHKSYKNYGAKGIKICEEWFNDFNSFYKWAIENGYSDNLTIDRINNDEDYKPSNCRWETMKRQQNNRTNNVILNYNGEEKTLSEFSEKYKLKWSTLNNRLKRGYSIEKALTKEVIKKKKG